MIPKQTKSTNENNIKPKISKDDIVTETQKMLDEACLMHPELKEEKENLTIDADKYIIHAHCGDTITTDDLKDKEEIEKQEAIQSLQENLDSVCKSNPEFKEKNTKLEIDSFQSKYYVKDAHCGDTIETDDLITR